MVDPVDDSNEAPDDEDPAVVNPAITVIQSPAINILPSQTPVTGGTTNTPGVQSAGVGEMNEMNGRMKMLEGQVKGLMETLEASTGAGWFAWRLIPNQGKLANFHRRFKIQEDKKPPIPQSVPSRHLRDVWGLCCTCFNYEFLKLLGLSLWMVLLKTLT